MLLFVGVASHCLFAQPTDTTEHPATQAMNNTEQRSYELVSRRDTLLTNDSIIVIHTVCAPMCSSHARVYNKEWQVIGELKAPFRSIFPEAYIEDNHILWRDNDTLDYTPAP